MMMPKLAERLPTFFQNIFRELSGMAVKKVTIDPITRIEGHLKIETTIDNGIVTDAFSCAEMFRGIEKALIGYDARVATQITQRVCGVCPYAHAEAASLALENAMNVHLNTNGQLLRNIIIGTYQIYDYIFHFYQLSALDFIDIAAILQYRGTDRVMLAVRDWVGHELKSKRVYSAAPFLPRLKGDYCQDRALNFSVIEHYLEALEVLALLQKMVAIFGGKAPHPITLEAGGVTTIPTYSSIVHFSSLLERVEGFVTKAYYNDVLAVARHFRPYFREGIGYPHYLSFPFFRNVETGQPELPGGFTIGSSLKQLVIGDITEDTGFSFYSDDPAPHKPLDRLALTPLNSEQYAAEKSKVKNAKYTWTKAPRYMGKPMEVGAAARVINTYLSGNNREFNGIVDRINSQLDISISNYGSVMGRHLSRMIMAQYLFSRIRQSIELVKAEDIAFIEKSNPLGKTGIGMTEASRGALGHWLQTDSKGNIKNYELIVPSTWNLSPRDSTGQLGPLEKMLVGTRVADQKNPLELARIVRSVDPCVACSVH